MLNKKEIELLKKVLQNCIVEGNIIKLPEGHLERKLYLEVAKVLTLIGGKWKGHKIQGFVFQENPTKLLKQIANGEKHNLKEEFQFFETPDNIADKLVSLANIKTSDLILEPSAGQGAIVKAINRKFPKIKVYCYELMKVNQIILEKIESVIILDDDFLLTKERYIKFDKIIANPPFAKNQDIDHIIKMYKCLKIGGRLVSIASIHWQISNNKKETAFRGWLKEVNAEIIKIPKGEFNSSGTKVGGVIIIIDDKKE